MSDVITDNGEKVAFIAKNSLNSYILHSSTALGKGDDLAQALKPLLAGKDHYAKQTVLEILNQYGAACIDNALGLVCDENIPPLRLDISPGQRDALAKIIRLKAMELLKKTRNEQRNPAAKPGDFWDMKPHTGEHSR